VLAWTSSNDPTGRTPRPTETRPLHFAIMLRHSECAVLLIEAGCDVNVCCRREGGNPLCMALWLSASFDVTAIVSALVEAGADVNARYTAFDPSMSYLAGYTPLGLAVSGFHEDHVDDLYEIPKILLDAGADPNATFDCGNTALHLIVHLVEGAADEKMEKMARLLLDAGADTRRRNDEGRTPLEYSHSLRTHGNDRPARDSVVLNTIHSIAIPKTKSGKPIAAASPLRPHPAATAFLPSPPPSVSASS